MTDADLEALVRERLARLGLTGRVEIGREGGGVLRISYMGRDPAGHACPRRIEMALRGATDPKEVAATLDGHLAAQRRFAERSGLPHPVTPSMDMPLGHLVVNGPLARRLRLDHPADPGRALREALVSLIAGGGRRLGKQERPYDLVIDSNRLDHRETLGEGVEWRGRSLVMRGMELPLQIVGALAGRPASAVMTHHLLEGETIARVHTTHSRRTGPTVVLDTEEHWTPADRI